MYLGEESDGGLYYVSWVSNKVGVLDRTMSNPMVCRASGAGGEKGEGTGERRTGLHGRTSRPRTEG
jgi:hypothetical protein